MKSRPCQAREYDRYTVGTSALKAAAGHCRANPRKSRAIASLNLQREFCFDSTTPRFHYYFAARWNGVYAMPKHIWEAVDDPMTFDFSPPVSLGAYVFEDVDPAGYWHLFKRRDDWDRTTAGMITGKPGPEYILLIFYGGSERKVIAMARHDLDVFMNVDYEAFKALLESTPTARSWFKDFPWAYPNELDGRWFGFNYETMDWANIKDVRWALALALDIVDLHTEYIGGVSRITPIPQPATTFMMDMFHIPLESWLKELEIDVGGVFHGFIKRYVLPRLLQ